MDNCVSFSDRIRNSTLVAMRYFPKTYNWKSEIDSLFVSMGIF